MTLDRPAATREMPWHLVDGAVLFGTAVDADEAPARDVLEITPAVRCRQRGEGVCRSCA
ncbi:MAG: hypothetical protein R3E84_10060 [Pseudomonadales bacterium]